MTAGDACPAAQLPPLHAPIDPDERYQIRHRQRGALVPISDRQLQASRHLTGFVEGRGPSPSPTPTPHDRTVDTQCPPTSPGPADRCSRRNLSCLTCPRSQKSWNLSATLKTTGDPDRSLAERNETKRLIPSNNRILSYSRDHCHSPTRYPRAGGRGDTKRIQPCRISSTSPM